MGNMPTSRSEQNKCNVTPFCIRVASLFGGGPESFKKHNYLSFVSRANLRALSSIPQLCPFPSFSLTTFITMQLQKLKRERFSLPVVAITLNQRS